MGYTSPADLARREGWHLSTVYRRAADLNISRPYKFTASEVRRILAYKPKRRRGK